MTGFHSPNFDFLADLDPPRMHQAALAEKSCLNDPDAFLQSMHSRLMFTQPNDQGRELRGYLWVFTCQKGLLVDFHYDGNRRTKM